MLKAKDGEPIEHYSMRKNPPNKKDPLRSLFSNWVGADEIRTNEDVFKLLCELIKADLERKCNKLN